MAPKKSVIWSVFTEVDGGGKCNDCNKVIKCGGGSTTGLFYHLKQHPKIRKEVEEAKEAIKEEQKSNKKRSFSESFLSTTPKMTTPKINSAFQKFQKYPHGHSDQVFYLYL